MSVQHSVLLLSLPTRKHLQGPAFLSEAIRESVTQTQKSLLIIVFSPLFSTNPSQSESLALAPVHSWRDVQSLLTFIYVEAAREAQRIDNILLNVDVVLQDPAPAALDANIKQRYGADNWEAVFALDGDDIIPFDELPISHLPTTIFPSNFETPREAENNTPLESKLDVPDATAPADGVTSTLPGSYPVTALGGTFDHLHAGHKILLSVAAWIAKDKLIVGVTDEALLTKKANASVLESIDTRKANVRVFCERFKPSLEYDIVTINDVYGPTAWDANIQALVLSFETREGAAAVAKRRAERELPLLEPFVIDVISSSSAKLDTEDAAELRNGKMSSTAIRQWIVDKARERGDGEK